MGKCDELGNELKINQSDYNRHGSSPTKEFIDELGKDLKINDTDYNQHQEPTLIFKFLWKKYARFGYSSEVFESW